MSVRLYPRHVRPQLEAALDDTPVVVIALVEAIKSRVDRERRGGRRPAGLFLLTGSANVWATLKISESLAGRAERVQLWPLSQGEMLGRRETFLGELLAGRVPFVANAPTGRSAIAEKLVTGGYPEMLARTDPQRRARWARNYIEMILERDVSDLARGSRQLEELPRLLELSAAASSLLVLPRPLKWLSTSTRSRSSSRNSSTSERNSSQALRKSLQPLAMPASPVQLPGVGPSTITYSISGCAHSVELKSPRSQAA